MQGVASSTQYSSKIIDHLGLIMATIDKLQIIDLIDERLPTDPYKGTKTTMGQRVAAMILNGLGFMNDRLYMFPEFLESKPVAKFFGEGLNAKNFNDAALGRCLDSIHAYGTTKLFTEIAMLIAVNNNLLAKSAHLDTTSLTVYGDYPNTKEGELQLTQGYAKNKRFDLKQLVLTLATTGAAGFPIFMQANNGNVSDKKALVAAAEMMKKFTAELKNTPDFLYVGDSAFYENSVKYSTNMKFVSRVPESIKEARKYLETEEKNFKWEDLKDGYRITALKNDYGTMPQRWIMVYSEQAAKREKITLCAKISA